MNAAISPLSDADFRVPLIIRGRVIADPDLEFGGRRGGARFTSPDVGRHIDDLVLQSPSDLKDLYTVPFTELVDYLCQLGGELNMRKNVHMQASYELARKTSGLTDDILSNVYRGFTRLFTKDYLTLMMERTVGVKYLEGWIQESLPNGSRVSVRAFGARAVHIIAGNNPGVSALTIARNVLTRSDAIVKTPSNDPLTAAAIARTMIDMAPNHPATRHLSVAYWKGGDTKVEEILYQPRNIEKIIAWGGLASVSHIIQYIQPGIDLITLDPKLSSTIIGPEAFVDAATMASVAERLAHDVGGGNQEGCVNARVIYIVTGTDAGGLANAKHFGQLVLEAIKQLPSHISGPAKELNAELADELNALQLSGGDEHIVYGGGKLGAVIVSQTDEPVDFSALLCNRVANLVPVDSVDTPIRAVTAYTQTIGIYPESLKTEIRDRLAFHGAQRLVSLGYASNSGVMMLSGPQDAIEPTRRMCRWIVDEASDPVAQPLAGRVPPLPA
jgi:Acyl-CoA reductase (LuxC)